MFARIALLIVIVLVTSMASSIALADTKPNVIVFLADDLGYADIQCYGGRIPTPHIDRLAAEGMKFTDAHSTSSVCSPTRYSLLTGRYNWRSRLKRGVLGGLSPRLIEPGRMTVASMLQSEGYHTACIGKWHLGMDWVVKPGAEISELSIEPRDQVFNVDYSQPISNGPGSLGFDFFYGISASLDMVPYTFIENDRVTSLPTEDRDFLMMGGREKGGRTRKGPTAPDFDAMDVLPVMVQQCVEFIERRAGEAHAGKPFFLYVPFASPHTPILPTPDWQDKSGVNPYADFLMETDAAVGEVLAALAQHQLTDNTLVIFTSDNGCSPQAKFDELAEHDHFPSGPLRGHKADLFEGGLRVPTVVRWPGQVAAGSETSALICQIDLLATLAEILQVALPADAAEDSISFLTVLQGGQGQRDHLVSHSVNGSFAIRQGDWKLLLCADSGGWSAPRPGSKQALGLPPMQLYDLGSDLGEQNNLVEEHPDRVQQLIDLLEQFVADGRSTPGEKQANNGPVDIRLGMPQKR
jgi:arylsulfatase A